MMLGDNLHTKTMKIQVFWSNLVKRCFILIVMFWRYILTFNAKKKNFTKNTKINYIIPLQSHSTRKTLLSLHFVIKYKNGTNVRKNETFLLYFHTKYGDNLLVNINCTAVTLTYRFYFYLPLFPLLSVILHKGLGF